MQGDTRIDVLKNIDLKVRYGEVVAILGPSGSGKSTLLNILGLLSTPASGSYLLDGTDTATFNAAQRAEARLDSIGFVFQAFHLIEHKNVYRNVELPLIYRGVPKAERAQRVADTLALLGLSHRTMHPSPLSRAVKSSVWLLLVRSLGNRRCCSVMSRPARWMKSSPVKSLTCSANVRAISKARL
jgi:macrolide export ATP-binding/permease protein macB